MGELSVDVNAPVLISSRAALVRAVERLSSAPCLAADTEGNGMYAYKASVCVVQLAVAYPDRPSDEVFLIDGIAVGDLDPLRALLSAEGPPKILHDIGFDARMLAAAGIHLGNVVDTAIHARFLGARETGLAALLSARFGLTVSKTMQQHDWAQRPLGPEALSYLATDVVHLGPLAESLSRDAVAKGITDEIAAETRYTLDRAIGAAQEPAAPAYALVRGAKNLAPRARPVLREVFATREAIAFERDLPVGRVLSSQTLLAVSRLRPKNLAALRQIEGFTAQQAPYAEAILEAVARGSTESDVSEADRAWFATEAPPSDLALRKTRESALTAWRKTESEARGVDPQVVLPGHALAMLVSRSAQSLDDLRRIDGMGELRVVRYGDALLAMLVPTP